MIELAEIFYSLQGEGPFSGKPAIFIRLSRCLEPYCPWCDTQFSWKKGDLVSEETILGRINAYPCQFIVITGGEPFLQWDSGLSALEQLLLKNKYQIQYETSGKVLLPSSPETTLVVSPKYLNANWHFLPENHSHVNAYKFLYHKKNDGAFIELFVKTNHIPPEKVWIMPLGATREEQLKSMPETWAFCQKNQFNLSARLHVLAFNTQTGV